MALVVRAEAAFFAASAVGTTMATLTVVPAGIGNGLGVVCFGRMCVHEDRAKAARDVEEGLRGGQMNVRRQVGWNEGNIGKAWVGGIGGLGVGGSKRYKGMG